MVLDVSLIFSELSARPYLDLLKIVSVKQFIHFSLGFRNLLTIVLANIADSKEITKSLLHVPLIRMCHLNKGRVND